MSYDSKNETEKEFGYSYEEVKSDPTPRLGDEYQDAKYVLSTLNREHATSAREKRKANQVKTIVTALAIGATSVTAIAVVMISRSKVEDNGQMAITMPVKSANIQDIKLICGDFDYSNTIYHDEEEYFIDTIPLYSGDYDLRVMDLLQQTYTDTTTIETKRGVLDASCTFDGMDYSVTYTSGDLSGFTHFASYAFYGTLDMYIYENGELIAQGDTFESTNGTVESVSGEMYFITFGSITRFDGTEISVPLVGTEFTIA